MRHTLIKYKDIKILVNEGNDTHALIRHLTEIENLAAAAKRTIFKVVAENFQYELSLHPVILA